MLINPNDYLHHKKFYNIVDRTFKGSAGEDGTLIKVALDRSGMYVATSCTDKTLAIYDYVTGECMATMFGHSELVSISQNFFFLLRR